MIQPTHIFTPRSHKHRYDIDERRTGETDVRESSSKISGTDTNFASFVSREQSGPDELSPVEYCSANHSGLTVDRNSPEKTDEPVEKPQKDQLAEDENAANTKHDSTDLEERT